MGCLRVQHKARQARHNADQLRDVHRPLNIWLMHKYVSLRPTVARSVARRVAGILGAAGTLFLMPSVLVHAQGGGGGGQGGGSATAPAASANLKRAADRDDPLNFLLTKKKLLLLDRPLEDSLKKFRKEMQHYQDVVYKDLDKAATRKDQGQLPGPSIIATMTRESEERVKDIQSAYRDRARLLLSERQRAQVDSLEGIWRRDVPRGDGAVRKPPV